MGFHGLTDILRQLRDRYPVLEKRWNEAQALQNWEKIVGPAIARNAQPLRVEGGILWVQVEHPIWRAELHARKAQILAALNKEFQDTPLTDLQFTDTGASQRRASRFAKKSP